MTLPAGSIQRLDNWQVSPSGQVQGYMDQWTGNPVFRGLLSQVGAVGTPSGIANTGSIGTNGAITLGTSLGLTYGPTSNNCPGVWLYFPAGALYTGSIAGSYWCVMTSGTAGTAYNNLLPATGAWTPPTTPSPIVAAGPGAYTGATTIQTLGTIVVPANMMGPQGALLVTRHDTVNNTGGNKTLTLAFGGTVFNAPVITTQLANAFRSVIRNRGVTNAQVGGPTPSAAGLGSSTTALVTSGTDTTVAQNVVLSGTLAAATDVLVMEAVLVEVIPG